MSSLPEQDEDAIHICFSIFLGLQHALHRKPGFEILGAWASSCPLPLLFCLKTKPSAQHKSKDTKKHVGTNRKDLADHDRISQGTLGPTFEN